MLLYSSTIQAFLTRAQGWMEDILEREMGVPFKRSRFLYRQYYYPVHLVVFERPGELGYFNHHHFQIGLHRQLMYSAKEVVIKNILRHELAHLFCFIEYGATVPMHGMEFRAMCARFGWDESVWAAKAEVSHENEKFEGDLASEKVISKIQKLLSLASSSNQHEAELATLKANQLLLKHHLEEAVIADEEIYYVRKIYEQTRACGKMKCLSEILTHFYLHPVLNYGKGSVFLEITGKKVQVELGQYVCDFLNHELDFMWEEAKKNNPELRGASARNSFFRGVARGYKLKASQVVQQFSDPEQKQLMVIENELKKQVQMIYHSLSSSRSSGKFNASAHNTGEKMGRNLNIRKGVGSSSSLFFLT
ncbi:MAG: DUF2786 domain-containing protein [Bacteriovoracaceae bacterium]|nr:DUF2786 domain-containing protein [Bacteriovoracaceae bacterium]